MDPSPPLLPDLASILQTLKAYTPSPANVPTGSYDLEDGEYDPAEYDPSQAVLSNIPKSSLPEQTITPSTTTSTTNITTTITPPIKKPTSAPPPSTKQPPIPSAASITTWPKALSFTIQHIFSSPTAKTRISHLILTQHAHERQWRTARDDLIRKAKARSASRKQLDSVLASVGGLVASSAASQPLQGEAKGDDDEGEEEMRKEAAIFDRKVHRACREMVAASVRELGEVGVPFFCSEKTSSDVTEKKKSEKKGEGEEELLALRRKMLQLLEDFCGHQEEG